MTDRDLIALMAAILAASETDNYDGPSQASHYVSMASQLLAEVDASFGPPVLTPDLGRQKESG